MFNGENLKDLGVTAEEIAEAIEYLRAEKAVIEPKHGDKYYCVEMPDGKTYGVPARIIADNYAKCYQERGEDYQENFDAMMDWFDTNDFEFADWAKNNMDWDEVKDAAVVISIEPDKEPVDFQAAWVNGAYSYLRFE